MVVCPKGHASEAADYCDECGARIDGPPVTGPPVTGGPAAGAPASACPVCGADLSGRFCEECGTDSLAPPGPLDPAVPPSAAPAPAPAPGEPAPLGATRSGEAEAPEAPAAAAPGGWWVAVTADREHYERMRALDGPDADEVDFPVFCPERRFPLAGRQVLIGRRSRSRGIYPEIDLVGPPEDAAVSHTHALLVPQSDGGWAVIDLRSTNRTYLNGDAEPIDAERPIPLSDGATVNVGAWTRLTLHAGRYE